MKKTTASTCKIKTFRRENVINSLFHLLNINHEYADLSVDASSLSSTFHLINLFFSQNKTPSSSIPTPPLAGPYSNLFARIMASSHWVRSDRKHTYLYKTIRF